MAGKRRFSIDNFSTKIVMHHSSENEPIFSAFKKHRPLEILRDSISEERNHKDFFLIRFDGERMIALMNG
jgi:hypothetical protein